MTVTLNTFDKVREFVNAISPFNAEFNLVSGQSAANAKSIMGIFSLDLSKPVELKTKNNEDIPETEISRLESIIKRFQA